MQKIEKLTRRFIDLYAAKDINAISDMFSEDIVLRDWNYEVAGKEAAIIEFTKNFDEAETLHISIKNIYLSELSGAAEIEVTVNGLILSIVDVVTFDSAEQITSVIAYRGF
jgi:ketosteroid isomerase-like protein